MDNAMAISGEKIRALCEARAWSQAHLAEAASLSLRTVQRVEAEGTASAETRLAIAAALGVSVDALNAPAAVARPATEAPPARRPRIDPDPWSRLLMFVSGGLAQLFILTQGGRLPARVATHFGVAGDANDYMTRDGFVACASLLVAALFVLWAFLVWAMQPDRLNLPNAEWWLAESRRPQTVAWLLRRVTWLCVGLVVFVAYMFWLEVVANLATPAHPVLDNIKASVAFAVLLAATAAWITTVSLRFRHVPT